MKLSMLIDQTRCIGCRTCMTVCKNCNSQPPGMWWNRVFTVGSDVHQVAYERDEHDYVMQFLPVACQMCENPACQKVCPTGATFTDAAGVVLVDYEKCIGCRFCISACPYGARQFNWEDAKGLKEMGESDYVYGYPEDCRQDGHLVYERDRKKGVAEKCTFCAQCRELGENPACVIGCPANARIFGDLDDPESSIRRYMKHKQVSQLLSELGTDPKVFYIEEKEETSFTVDGFRNKVSE